MGKSIATSIVARQGEYKEVTKYYTALGKFIHIFSGVEFAVKFLLHVESNTTVNAAKAIFSGVRIDTGISHIKRIYKANQQELDPLLSKAFDQLSEINGRRNDIVHFGASGNINEFKVTNSHLAITPEQVKSFPISAEILDVMSLDLTAIWRILDLFSSKNTIPPDEFQFCYKSYLKQPFLYKSSQSGKTRQQSQNKSRKRAAPHPSSAE